MFYSSKKNVYRCGVSWSEEHVSLDCSECGGYSLQRPCPLCDGRCRTSWKRDLTMVRIYFWSIFFFSLSPWPIVYSINIFKKRVFGWFVIFIHYFFPNKHSWSLEKKKKRNKKEPVKKKIKKFISNLLI